jgi:hypothetical protein
VYGNGSVTTFHYTPLLFLEALLFLKDQKDTSQIDISNSHSVLVIMQECENAHLFLKVDFMSLRKLEKFKFQKSLVDQDDVA